MTVQTSTTVATGIGNGVTTNFPTGFKFNHDEDLFVILIDTATEAVEQLALNSDYTVQGAGREEGGIITTAVPVPAGKTIRAFRIVDLLQLTDLRNQGKFFAEVHEDTFDLIVMMIQQQQEQLDRSVKVPIGSDTPADDLLAEFKADIVLADAAAALSVQAKNESQAIAAQFGDVAGAVAATEALRNETADLTAIAESSAASAEVDADRAETARDAAIAGATGFYVDTAAGLSATVQGDYFSTPSSDQYEFLILYRHDPGPEATEIASYPSAKLIQSDTSPLLASIEDSSKMPVVEIDDRGRVSAEDFLFGNSVSTADLASQVSDASIVAQSIKGEYSRFIDRIHASLAPSYAPSSPVYDSASDGYPAVRLPVTARLSKTEFMVFANGQASFGDFGIVNLIARKITVGSDGSIVKGAVQVLEQGGSDDGAGYPYQYGNASAIKTDTGRLIVLYTYRNEQALEHIPYMKYSDDDGATWSDRVDLTSFFPELGINWNAIIFGPGKMIQIDSGPYKGRILCASWRSDMAYPINLGGLYSFITYSDDNGETWSVGAESFLPRGNECAIAKDWEGDIILLMRREGVAGKHYGRSKDCGISFYEYGQLDQESINAPVVQAGFTQTENPFDFATPKLAMSSPKPSLEATATAGQGRENPTIYLSYDGGRSFPYQYQISSGYCGYSVVEPVGEAGFLVIWESVNSRNEISGQVVSIKQVLGV